MDKEEVCSFNSSEINSPSTTKPVVTDNRLHANFNNQSELNSSSSDLLAGYVLGERCNDHDFSTPCFDLSNTAVAMASPNDSYNSYYTARDRDSNPVSPSSPSVSSPEVNFNNVCSNVQQSLTSPNPELFAFAVPMPAMAQGTTKVPSSKAFKNSDNVGLNIFASPPPPTIRFDDEEFISATALADTTNANDWDALLFTRSSSGVVPSTANRWDRDSLYQRFDPLVRTTTPPQHQMQQRFEEMNPILDVSFDQHHSSVVFPTVTVADSNDDFPTSSPVDGDTDVVGDDEDPDGDTLMVTSNEDFSYREPRNREESNEDMTLVSPQQCSDETAMPGLDQIHEVEARLETALLQQEQNFRAELVEKDEQIRHLELRLAMALEPKPKVEAPEKAQLIEAMGQIDDLKATLVGADDEKRVMTNQLKQLTEDFLAVKNNFTDVTMKYEQVKCRLENCRRNEDLLIQRDAAMTTRMTECDALLVEIRDSVKTKLDNMFQYYEAKFKDMNIETGRLRTQLRRAEMKNEGLENELTQKSSEMKKMSLLCDDLILQNMRDGR